MTKRAFQVGDRVRVYSFWISAGNAGRAGTVKRIEPNGLRILIDGTGEVSAHIKQCRRLKPKPQKERGERRAWWVLRNPVSGGLGAFFTTKTEAQGTALASIKGWELLRLVECSELETPVSREKFLKACGLAFTMPGNERKQMDPTLCLAIAECLNLPEAKS